MTNDGIIRDPTAEELRSYIDVPLNKASGRIKTPKDKFNEKLAEEQQKCIKQGLPFAEAAARAEIKDAIDAWTSRWKRRGHIDEKKDPLPSVEWSKYSDVKNFEVIADDKKHDPYLSKIHRLPVFVEFKTYKYKGYSNTYTVMESEESATERAVQKLETRAKKVKE